jgi:excisionase family DNA binding protein
MNRLDQRDAIRALDEVRTYLVAEGKSELVGKVADVIDSLRPSAQPPAVDLLSTSEAAALLGVRSINTIKRWASDGLLEGYRVGGRIKVTRASVDAMLKSPIAERQRTYEHDLDAALEPFDGGDEPLPPTGRAHEGRKPWDMSQHARR